MARSLNKSVKFSKAQLKTQIDIEIVADATLSLKQAKELATTHLNNVFAEAVVVEQQV